tara:strand:+ start:388 stop:891 length:504 start_codon:yes stop_codon:yes gene_type:complete
MSDSIDGNFAYRNQSGKEDIAGEKAKEWLDKNNVSYKVIGFNPIGDRIPTRQWLRLCPFLRKMPDILIFGHAANYFLEVKCCQYNLHLKLVDLVEYPKWDALHGLDIFVYSTKKDSIYIMSLKALLKQASIVGFSTGKFKDNDQQYISIPVENLTKYKKSNNEIVIF